MYYKTNKFLKTNNENNNNKCGWFYLDWGIIKIRFVWQGNRNHGIKNYNIEIFIAKLFAFWSSHDLKIKFSYFGFYQIQQSQKKIPQSHHKNYQIFLSLLSEWGPFGICGSLGTGRFILFIYQHTKRVLDSGNNYGYIISFYFLWLWF